jgi:hypothetical protein
MRSMTRLLLGIVLLLALADMGPGCGGGNPPPDPPRDGNSTDAAE